MSLQTSDRQAADQTGPSAQRQPVYKQVEIGVRIDAGQEAVVEDFEVRGSHVHLSRHARRYDRLMIQVLRGWPSQAATF